MDNIIKLENNIVGHWIDDIESKQSYSIDTIFRDLEIFKKYPPIENLKKLTSSIYNKDNINIVELGCGSGKWGYAFSDLGNVTFVDCVRRLIDEKIENEEIIKQLFDIKSNFYYYNCSILEFKSDKKFTLIVNEGTFEHYIDENHRLAYINKCLDLLTDNGTIICVVPDYLVHGEKDDEFPYTPDSLSSFFSQSFKEIYLYRLFGFIGYMGIKNV